MKGLLLYLLFLLLLLLLGCLMECTHGLFSTLPVNVPFLASRWTVWHMPCFRQNPHSLVRLCVLGAPDDSSLLGQDDPHSLKGGS